MRIRGIDTDKTQAYDSHCNLVLGEVEETIYIVEDDEDDANVENVRTERKKSEMLFVRGESVPVEVPGLSGVEEWYRQWYSLVEKWS